MKILLLSAYDADSHRRWWQGLIAHLPQCQFTVLSLPARYFSWRIRGNALTWALGHVDALTEHPWDAIIATSMVDLATLKGLVPALACVPSLVYFHENQFAYPVTSGAHASIEPQMVSLYSALAATQVIFNSQYNRHTFLTGVEQLLRQLPDQIPSGIVPVLQAKSVVLPVPLEREAFFTREPSAPNNKPLNVVWNHRWEYDKNPDLLLAVIQALNHSPQTEVCWHIVGQQFRRVPEAFALIAAELNTAFNGGQSLGSWGFLPLAEYQHVLKTNDVALSTALHDFQGLAVMDAVAAGCIPLLPNRVAYPDFFAEQYLYSGSSANEAEVIAQKIIDLAKQKRAGHLIAAPSLKHLQWTALAAQYWQALQRLVQ